mmetsp:Transcript_23628/g.72690  ORF Transcript_23628/g.72690 Transcript_23628/m.72690 type:complete len:230 (+) Transcript_23628:998-1687(+)
MMMFSVRIFSSLMPIMMRVSTKLTRKKYEKRTLRLFVSIMYHIWRPNMGRSSRKNNAKVVTCSARSIGSAFRGTTECRTFLATILHFLVSVCVMEKEGRCGTPSIPGDSGAASSSSPTLHLPSDEPGDSTSSAGVSSPPSSSLKWSVLSAVSALPTERSSRSCKAGFAGPAGPVALASTTFHRLRLALRRSARAMRRSSLIILQSLSARGKKHSRLTPTATMVASRKAN